LKENFDRFNFAIHKEKEMADFRKWIIVLFALTLVAGLGSAQTIGSGTSMTCNFASTPTLPVRAESFSDAVGDIVISCTGGQVLAQGTAVPLATITVTLNTAITSRLIPITGTNGSSAASEALLLIDDPGSTETVVVAGSGPQAPQVLCTTPAVGCTATVNYVAPISGIIAGNPNVPVAASNQGYTSFPNVYQGVVTGTSVTFFGVPILPPGTTGTERIIRITNIRANAPGVGAGQFNVTPIYANVSSNNAIPLSNPQVEVGFVQNSLTTSLSLTPTSTSSPVYSTFLQCTGNKVSSVGAAATVLNFKELFSSAFKTRVVPLTNTLYAAQGTNPTGQNVPGGLYLGNPGAVNSESDFIFPIVGNCSGSSITGCAGLADFGTRLKAVFSNVPTGVSLYVSVQNVQPATPANPVGGTSTAAYAQLVSSELAPEVTSAPVGNVSFGGTANVVQVPVVNGSATAVWEVINANPNAIDTFQFPIYTAVAANTTTAPSVAYVAMSYAPTPNGGANFSATGAAAAEGYSYPIPRFQDPTAAPTPFLAVSICQTALLWPYVVTGPTINGFDTGLAIANTTTDPFGTTAQNGSCNLYFYGQNYNGSGAVASATTTPIVYGCDQTQANAANCVGIGTTKVIGSGQAWANLASALVTPPTGNYWLGYTIGICNFQDAHGYAAITDVGVRNIISSYLALVMEPSALRGTTVAVPIGETFAH